MAERKEHGGAQSTRGGIRLTRETRGDESWGDMSEVSKYCHISIDPWGSI